MSRIRAAAAADLPALLAIEEASFPGDRLDARAFRHALRSPTIATLVLAEGGEVAGYAMAHLRRGSDIARVTSVAIAPGRGGRGLGRVLLRAIEDEAEARGCRRVRLEVRADNAPARRLYEATGYAGLEEVPGYYEDGETALRYEKRLAAPEPPRG